MTLSKKRSSSKKAMKRSSSKKRKSSRVKRKSSRVKRKSSRVKRKSRSHVMKGGDNYQIGVEINVGPHKKKFTINVSFNNFKELKKQIIEYLEEILFKDYDNEHKKKCYKYCEKHLEIYYIDNTIRYEINNITTGRTFEKFKEQTIFASLNPDQQRKWKINFYNYKDCSYEYNTHNGKLDKNLNTELNMHVYFHPFIDTVELGEQTMLTKNKVQEINNSLLLKLEKLNKIPFSFVQKETDVGSNYKNVDIYINNCQPNPPTESV
jgi:hypothetical protein